MRTQRVLRRVAAKDTPNETWNSTGLIQSSRGLRKTSLLDQVRGRKTDVGYNQYDRVNPTLKRRSTLGKSGRIGVPTGERSNIRYARLVVPQSIGISSSIWYSIRMV